MPSSLATTSGLETRHTIYVTILRVQDQKYVCKTSIIALTETTTPLHKHMMM